MNSDLLEKIISDPSTIGNLSKEELVTVYENASVAIETLSGLQKVAREELSEKIDGGGEVIGDMQVIKAEKINVSTSVEQAAEFGAVLYSVDATKIPLEIAKEYQAIIETVDAATIRSLVRKGATIPGIEKVSYIIIKPVVKTKNVEDSAQN